MMNQEQKLVNKPEEKKVKLKKPKRRIVRGFFKSMINVRRWIGAEQIAQSGKAIVRSAKALFTIRKAQRIETFEEALQRLHLSEEDLAQRKRQFLRTSIIYVSIAALLLIYGFYLLFTAHHFATFACLSLAVLVSTYAIREHFWYMQIVKRKLGCSLKEWARFITNNILFRVKR